jgi:hypothetical protein
MSSDGKSHADKVNASIDAVKGRSMPSKAKMVAAAAIVWGIAALAYGLFAFDPAWTGGAALVAVFYGLCFM